MDDDEIIDFIGPSKYAKTKDSHIKSMIFVLLCRKHWYEHVLYLQQLVLQWNYPNSVDYTFQVCFMIVRRNSKPNVSNMFLYHWTKMNDHIHSITFSPKKRIANI